LPSLKKKNFYSLAFGAQDEDDSDLFGSFGLYKDLKQQYVTRIILDKLQCTVNKGVVYYRWTFLLCRIKHERLVYKRAFGFLTYNTFTAQIRFAVDSQT